MWNVCIADNLYNNVEKIFPTQQRDVGELVKELKVFPEVIRIIIFGSSVTSACNPWSDIDVYVDLKNDILIRPPKFEVGVDLWTNFDVDERLLDEINAKGVVVYER